MTAIKDCETMSDILLDELRGKHSFWGSPAASERQKLPKRVLLVYRDNPYFAWAVPILQEWTEGLEYEVEVVKHPSDTPETELEQVSGDEVYRLIAEEHRYCAVAVDGTCWGGDGVFRHEECDLGQLLSWKGVEPREDGTWKGIFHQMVENGIQPPSSVIVCEKYLTDHMTDENGQLVCTLSLDDRGKAVVPELDELWAAITWIAERSGASVSRVSREELLDHVLCSPRSEETTKAWWIVVDRHAIPAEVGKMLVDQFRKNGLGSQMVPIILPARDHVLTTLVELGVVSGLDPTQLAEYLKRPALEALLMIGGVAIVRKHKAMEE